ncbi:MAG: nucleoside-diphosphate kinase [Patescibacteria group bacterium]
MEHKKEQTLTIIKPDGVQRGLIGEIIGRYERIGLKLVGMKMLRPTRELIEKHYTIDPEWLRLVGEKLINNTKEKGGKLHSEVPEEIGRGILGRLVDYMAAGPVIAMVWEGAHAVSIVRKLTGGTEPLSSDVGTIRGDFVLDSYQMSNDHKRAVRNLVHASGSVKEAQDEIMHWFKPEELMKFSLVQEKILYDVNLDGLAE